MNPNPFHPFREHCLIVALVLLLGWVSGCQNQSFPYSPAHVSLAKAVDLFYEENRNKEALLELDKIASAKLNPEEVEFRKIITAAALCELGKRDSAMAVINNTDQAIVDKNPSLLFLHRGIMGLIMFRNNDMLKSYSTLDQTVSGSCNERALGLNKRILGRISLYMNDFKQALEWLRQSSLHFTRAGLTKSVAINEKIIGRCYMLAESYDEAIVHFKKAETELLRCGDEMEMFYVLINILDYHLKKGNLQGAREYARLASLSCDKVGDDDMFILLNNNLGEIAQAEGNSKDALAYFAKTLDVCKRTRAIRSEVIADIGLTVALLNENRRTEAGQYAHRAVATALADGQKQVCFMAYKNLADFYKHENDIRAVGCQDTAMRYRDSTYRASTDIYKDYYNAKTELEQAASQVQLLTHKQQKRAVVSLSILTLLAFLLLFLFGLYQLQRKRLHANIELVKRNMELTALRNDSRKVLNGNSVRLSDERIAALLPNLNYLMENEKVYCNPDLNQNMLAELLKTNREYLSQLINNVLGKNFTDYINDYRVEEAKQLMAQQAARGTKLMSIAGIATTAGFKNTSTFNPVFKQATGLTPSAYQKAMESSSELTNP